MKISDVNLKLKMSEPGPHKERGHKLNTILYHWLLALVGFADLVSEGLALRPVVGPALWLLNGAALNVATQYREQSDNPPGPLHSLSHTYSVVV